MVTNGQVDDQEPHEDQGEEGDETEEVLGVVEWGESVGCHAVPFSCCGASSSAFRAPARFCGARCAYLSVIVMLL